jgi:uncharacterized RDD family membrane protein YckC
VEDRESILGLDNIRLELPIAGVGSRTLAGFLDYLALFALVILWLIVWGVFFAGAGGWAVAVAAAGVFLLEWGYFAVSEIASGGRTLGKRAVKLRVITAEGGTPRPGALLARNLVRSIDLLFGIPLMAIDPMSRRLGDRLAGTLGVHERRREAMPSAGFMEVMARPQKAATRNRARAMPVIGSWRRKARGKARVKSSARPAGFSAPPPPRRRVPSTASPRRRPVAAVPG